MQGEGLSYIADSYHVFGNDGTHLCCDDPITTGTGAASNILNALATASDHLPVVADYHLPAAMGVSVDSVPVNVPFGSLVELGVRVENIANVLTSIGADELDYTLSVTGDLIGGASGIAQALGGAKLHTVTLETSSLGTHSGTIAVNSSSQAVANGNFSLPISFQVISGCDFTDDSHCNLGDINTMFEQGDLVAGVSGGNQFDLNGDAVLDNDDVDLWLSEAAMINELVSSYRRGDTEFDRDVDITDFNVSGQPTSIPREMDIQTMARFGMKAILMVTDDTDITDFNLLAANFSPSGYSTSAIPEPSSDGAGVTRSWFSWVSLSGCPRTVNRVLAWDATPSRAIIPLRPGLI